MQVISLGEFSDISFAFIDLKKNYSTLDKELKREFDWLVKSVQRVCTSPKKAETEIEQLFPKLFQLRVKALGWMAEKKNNVTSVFDEVFPLIKNLGEDSKIKKIAFNISNALSNNKKLVEFLESKGEKLTHEKIKSINNLDYTTYLVLLQYMPSQLRRIVSELLQTSLYIEFFSLSAILIHEKTVQAGGQKILELTNLSSKITESYIAHIHVLINIGQQEMFTQEHDDWMKISTAGFANAYSEDEPDISHLILKEPNPEYNPN